jgi:hypothetical protein
MKNQVNRKEKLTITLTLSKGIGIYLTAAYWIPR